MDTALENNRACVFVLELVQKANLLIDGKKYYSALRVFKGVDQCTLYLSLRISNLNIMQTLDELETVYLPHILQHSFAKHLRRLDE